MAAIKCILVVFLLCGVISSNAEISSGSGSGDENPCEDVECDGGECVVEYGEAKCSCDNGTAIYDNKYVCEECAIGYWGKDCLMECSDSCGGEGHFSSCDAKTGECICNDCWMGTNCDTATPESDAFSCVLKYLESVDKDLDDYGGFVPRAADSALLGLAEDLVEDSGTIVQDDSITMSVISREEVDARPLLRFSFILREGPGNTDYDNAVSSIKDKVKTGEIRGTLIIDESDGDSGTLTINA